MHYIVNYLLFTAKFITILIVILVFIALVISIAAKAKSQGKSKLKAKSLNDHFDSLKLQLIMDSNDDNALKDFKKSSKQKKKDYKDKTKQKLYVIEFKGDVKAKATSGLQEQVNAILLNHKDGDEVLLKLESGGGLVHAYGLAAAQLTRLKQAGIALTVAVDKVAASGGYMMAAVADTIIAAPFAVVGSIGVVAQVPNLHRFLEKKNIDFEQFTAGKYKRTITVFGKNTNEGKAKFQEELDETHALFKAHISKYRPSINCEKVATGEHWFACDTLDKNLVDEIKTSDDFILESYPDKDIILLEFHEKQSKLQKIMQQASLMISNSIYDHRYGG